MLLSYLLIGGRKCEAVPKLDWYGFIINIKNTARKFIKLMIIFEEVYRLMYKEITVSSLPVVQAPGFPSYRN